jgi:hypothetical protein
MIVFYIISNLISEAWHFFFGWAGINIAIGTLATLVAILEPKFLDAITDLRKWAIVVAVVAFTATGLIGYGYRHGLAERDREHAAALDREIRSGEKAGEDAERALPPTADRSVFRNDPFNRNRDGHKQSCK